MAHQLGAPLPSAPPQEPQPYRNAHHGMHPQHMHQESLDELEGRMPRNCPRTHPWCSVAGCTERPLRQYLAASTNQIVFMCKTHFNTVPLNTREGWKQYRGTRTFPETRIAASCRPGPNRGHGAAAAAAAAAASTEVDPGYTNHPDDERSGRGTSKSALWPGKVYNVLYQVWNAHSEHKKMSTGDGYMTSCNRAALVPEAANVLREQGHPEMARILDNTTDGARKVIHSRVLAKYLKNREAFTYKIQNMGLDPAEVADWEAALNAAQHHADLAPARERETVPPYSPQPTVHKDVSPEAVGGMGAGAAAAASAAAAAAVAAATGGEPGVGAATTDEAGRSPHINNGVVGSGGDGAASAGVGSLAMIRKKPGRKPGKMNKVFLTPEAKRARALDSMVSAAERSNVLHEGAVAAGAEHMRRLEVADAERLAMEKEEHALRMAIGKSALTLLSKMAGEPAPQLSPTAAAATPPPPLPPLPPPHESAVTHQPSAAHAGAAAPESVAVPMSAAAAHDSGESVG